MASQQAADARAQRGAANAALADRVRAVHAQDRAYDALRVTAGLNDGTPADEGVNHKRVARVMRQHGLAVTRLRRRVRTTVPEPADAKAVDLAKRDFTAPPPTSPTSGTSLAEVGRGTSECGGCTGTGAASRDVRA